MKEATQTPYNKCIFRETFSSETETRKQASSVTDVTISKGVGRFNGTSSGIVYNKNFNGTYSIRIRFKEPTSFASSQYLCDFRQGTGVGYIYCSETTIVSPGGTKYANGVASTSSIAVKEIVVSGMPITSTELTMGRRTAPFTSYFIGDLELFEIYEGTLTDSEVKNLYRNSWAKDDIKKDLLLDYDSTNGYITDRTGKNTLTATDVSIKKMGNYYSADFNGTTSTLITDSTDPTIWQDGFTVVAWVRRKERKIGRIVDKGTTVGGLNGFYFGCSTSGALNCNINNGGVALSDTYEHKLNECGFVAITVSSDSRINFYSGDLDNAPALSGTANQTSGLISGITTTNPLTIGNRSTYTDRGFGGNIKMAKAYSGVLSLEQLTKIWSSTRGNIE